MQPETLESDCTVPQSHAGVGGKGGNGGNVLQKAFTNQAGFENAGKRRCFPAGG